MSFNNLPHILIRKCEERNGIRITEKYLESWCSQRQLSSDMESEYTALVSDFLNTEMALTSTPVIADDIANASFTTFPPGNFRRGGGVVLEIVDVDDLSNSALSILESLTNTTHVRRGVVTTDSQPDIQRGTLHWILSDGTRHIHAMENETIPELSLTTPFGCKLLIKSCQVRRGMLLLDRRSVTVLGGETPAAFNYNMINELISRLKIRLGLAPESTLSSSTNNPFDGSTMIDQSIGSTAVNSSTATTTIDLEEMEDYGDMDMNDEIFYHALEDMEANALKTQTTNKNDMDEYMDDDWDPELLDKVLPVTPSKSNQRSNASTPIKTTSTLHDKRPTTTIDWDNAGEGPSNLSSYGLHPNKRQRILETSPPPRAEDLDDYMWGNDDDDVFGLVSATTTTTTATTTNTSNAKEKNKIPDVNGDTKERWSLDRLSQTLKKMEKDEPVGSLPDIVIIHGTLKKFGQMKLTKKLGFYLVGYLNNPLDKNDESIRILLRNEVVIDLLNGKSYAELVEGSQTAEGKQKILRNAIKPLQTTLQRKSADIEVDLSLCERDKESVLMPLVRKYKTIG